MYIGKQNRCRYVITEDNVKINFGSENGGLCRIEGVNDIYSASRPPSKRRGHL